MSTGLFVFWALVGWCGTPTILWPQLDPPPDPWRPRLIGVIGGLVGGFLFNEIWPMGGGQTAVAVAVTAVGAWVGSVLLNNMYGLARSLSGKR